MKPELIIKTIEAYRTAYWAHRDLDIVTKKNYRPLVCQGQRYDNTYMVYIFDTWVERRPGQFAIAKEIVSGSEFSNRNLEKALEALLEFTRSYFEQNDLFDRI